MTTQVATRASVSSLLTRLTVNGKATSVLLRVTVAVTWPPRSGIEAGEMLRESVS